MKIHYLSTHETLEWQEVLLLTELGHEVFANGAYLDPKGHISLKRPGIPNAPYFPEYIELSRNYPKTHLPPELIEPFDLIWAMHTPEFISENWDRMRHKKVLWRSIGQSTKHVENMLRKFRYDGMKIVRMSPMEKNIEGYMGHDTIIRFYGDENELNNWNGNTKRIINVTQSLKGRRIFCHHDSIMQIMEGFPSLVYGSGNEDLGALNGGELTYDNYKGALRDNRVFVYGGTWPSPYTLSPIDVMLTGMPIVCIGAKLAEELPEIAPNDRYHYYEMENIIENGRNGFISNTINELRNNVHQLLEDQELARSIGDAGRATAIELFGKEKIKKEWENFLENL